VRYIMKFNSDGTVTNVTANDSVKSSSSGMVNMTMNNSTGGNNSINEIAYMNGFILVGGDSLTNKSGNKNGFAYFNENLFRDDSNYTHYEGEPLTGGTGLWWDTDQMIYVSNDPVHGDSTIIRGIVNHPLLPYSVYVFDAKRGTIQMMILKPDPSNSNQLTTSFTMFVCRAHDYNNTLIQLNGSLVQATDTNALSIDPLTGYLYQTMKTTTFNCIMRIPTVYTVMGSGTTSLNLLNAATYGANTSPVVSSAFTDGSFSTAIQTKYPVFQYNAADGVSRAMINLSMFLAVNLSTNMVLYVYNRQNMFLPRMMLPSSTGWNIVDQKDIDASFILNHGDMFTLIPSSSGSIINSGTIVIEKMGIQAGGGKKAKNASKRYIIHSVRESSKKSIPSIKTLCKKRGRDNNIILSDKLQTKRSKQEQVKIPGNKKTQKQKPMKLVV